MAGTETNNNKSTRENGREPTTSTAASTAAAREAARSNAREIEQKQKRLAEFLDRHQLDGVFLQQRANFAWVTGGRDNHIANNTPEGVAGILATKDSRVCLANVIEAPRMASEELVGTGI